MFPRIGSKDCVFALFAGQKVPKFTDLRRFDCFAAVVIAKD